MDEATTVTTAATSGRTSIRQWDHRIPHGQAILLALPLVVTVVGFVLYPLAKLVVDSLTAGDGLGNYVAVFTSGASRRALLTTLVISLLVTVVSVVLGAVLAWVIRTTRSRLGSALVWLAVLLPLWMGVVVKNYAISFLLARDGIVNSILIDLGVIDTPIEMIYTPFAVVVGMTFVMMSYATLSLLVTFMTVDLDLLHAARSMGASRPQVAWTIVLPIARRGILASAAIVFAISIGFYITPVLLGGTSTPFAANLIQNQIFMFFDYPQAAATSTVLLVVAAAMLFAAFARAGRDAVTRALT